MAVELDHLFICTPAGAPEVDQLLKFGLTEGQGNFHPGQGTASRRVFLRNAYLELLWVQDEQEARGQLAGPLRLWERWQHQRTGYSPFGLGFHSAQRTAEPVKVPFETWAYRPPYLPQPLKIDVAENSAYAAEPLLFYTSFGNRPDRYPEERKQPLEHPVGFNEITGLRITLPEVGSRSRALEAVEQAGLANFIVGEAHLAEVTFDQAKQGKVQDFRPGLPLVFRW